MTATATTKSQILRTLIHEGWTVTGENGNLFHEATGSGVDFPWELNMDTVVTAFTDGGHEKAWQASFRGDLPAAAVLAAARVAAAS